MADVTVYIWLPSSENRYGHASIALGSFYQPNTSGNYNPGYISFWPGGVEASSRQERYDKFGKAERKTAKLGTFLCSKPRFPIDYDQDLENMEYLAEDEEFKFSLSASAERRIANRWRHIISIGAEYKAIVTNCCDVVGLCLGDAYENPNDYKRFISGYNITYPEDIVRYCNHLRASGW